ncbi:hypothetical protein M407DRAFT_241525 [Tulasnella calospora MUT 4182]|uniref:Ribosomal protein S6 n=1 Tax=Tulasnella calospora MUT 4182 TaxID=1051891 RepID=A0A0C3QJ69_9AGAM|nr:hypothetical protein M407DRAFT_241525 [Tulasnella calospora MUT 4182]
MPLYEILCISAHAVKYEEIHGLVKQTALTVMNNGGVVRSINSWGTRTLPMRIKRYKASHNVADYWTMHFDASPKLMKSVAHSLKADERVLRWTTTKLGERLEDIAKPAESTVVHQSSSRKY